MINIEKRPSDTIVADFIEYYNKDKPEDIPKVTEVEAALLRLLASYISLRLKGIKP